MTECSVDGNAMLVVPPFPYSQKLLAGMAPVKRLVNTFSLPRCLAVFSAEERDIKSTTIYKMSKVYIEKYKKIV